MEQLRLKSNDLASKVSTDFVRSQSADIHWQERLVGIIGPVGVGKTTLLLQQLKLLYGHSPSALYVTMDDLYLANLSLRDFAAQFASKGGKHLFIDNVHKLPSWSFELKKIFETLPNIKVAFAGSSTIEMVKHYTHLSQRATIHNIGIMSFREFLALKGAAMLPTYSLQTLLSHHIDIAAEHVQQFAPSQYLDEYLTQGCYPFIPSDYEEYKRFLEDLLVEVIEQDMVYIDGFDAKNVFKIKQLVSIIAQNAPFKPNLVKISNHIGIHRNTLISYIFHLEKAKLITLLYPAGSNVSILQKPESVILSNTNLTHLLSGGTPTRELLVNTFALSHLGAMHPIKNFAKNYFEVDGSILVAPLTLGKKLRKAKSELPTYTFADGFDVGTRKYIPLWLLGLLH
ncbi:MAG: AAA family ATPase [Bacteroidales bacterium]|jgi:predicted AAA+ superfamily ATPase|nr:AAA family ATPase [Bacteroidales bacterium]MDD4672710.1 AAA family ATPase [Bacteroidales bacterium]MDY0347568.1 AAA family ATPase [Tenuifilaceae bacterium]